VAGLLALARSPWPDALVSIGSGAFSGWLQAEFTRDANGNARDGMHGDDEIRVKVHSAATAKDLHGVCHPPASGSASGPNHAHRSSFSSQHHRAPSPRTS